MAFEGEGGGSKVAVVKRALISVYDKEGLEALIEELAKYKVEIISSRGTAERIRGLGYRAVDVSKYTGFPEGPEGLLKTLHPKIHGGLLLDPKKPSHKTYMERHGILPIDLVVVNLYPFEEVVGKGGVTVREAAGNIDIGGSALMRAAAKGALLHGRVSVITDTGRYGSIIEELRRNKGSISIETRRKLALEAFKRTAEYDGAIDDFLSNRPIFETRGADGRR